MHPTLRTLTTLGFSAWLSACALVQPPSSIVERNYDSDSRTRRVKLGNDFNLWPPLEETQDHARQRLLAEIAAECPQPELLAEGTDRQNRVDIGINRISSETDHYVWVRYRCRRGQ